MDKNMLYSPAPANRMRQSITRDHIKVELKKYQIYVGGVVQNINTQSPARFCIDGLVQERRNSSALASLLH